MSPRWVLSQGMVMLFAVGLLAGCDQPAATPGGARAPQAHLVELVQARLAPMTLDVDRTGTLKARRNVRLFNQVVGRIDRVTAYPGDRVSEGQLLVRLDAALLQADLDKANAQHQQAKLDLERLQRLHKQRLVADEELARARTQMEIAAAEEAALRTRLSYTEIRAPFAGVVSERHVEPGDVAPLHSHLLTLMDPASLYTEVVVSELLLPSLQLGSPVRIRIDALGRQEHVGKISRIHPTVDAQTRLGRVEVVLDQVPAGAHPGQLARLRLTGAALSRLSIPFEALRRDELSEYVFVVNEGRAQRRAVRTGLRIADRVEVLEGLRDGDQLVSRGFLGLTDGKAVQPVNSAAKTAGQG